MYPKAEFEDQSYVVAVSGGVDSMVLLDLVASSGKQIVAAHYQHNVRSSEETQLDYDAVKKYCDTQKITLETGSYELSNFSESALREARYTFLSEVRTKYRYNVVITAHHFDDYIETSIINLLRGTQSAGLDGIAETDTLKRPLLAWRKADIENYARHHKLTWHEDSTNTDQKYLRNYVRQTVIPKLQAKGVLADYEAAILDHAPVAQELRQTVAAFLDEFTVEITGGIEFGRSWFTQLPHSVSKSVLHGVLSDKQYGADISSSAIDKLVVFAKTAADQKTVDISKNSRLCVVGEKIQIVRKA